ncbi:MAG: nucleoside triphosphate pyrophosphohydrolase [Deltaproteobacteria bacterium]|nr:nucleoside triphosphate pyrophosphohydrolase [Deltaproteobacteria bacterium]
MMKSQLKSSPEKLSPEKVQETFRELWQVVCKLRSREGCPWDREQDFSSMKNQFLEEVYEFVDALEADESPAMAEELGDLFFHLLFFSCLAEDENRFTLDQVLEQIKAKLIRRHPHVFTQPEAEISTLQVKANWEKIKREVEGKKYVSLLDGIPTSLPPLLKTLVFGQKAAKVGFDWPSPAAVIPKIKEELSEVEEVIEAGGEPLEEELGDLLFVAVNMIRLSGFEPGRVLHRANQKFERRFRFMEAAALTKGSNLAGMELEEQELLWEQAKVESG